MGYPRAASKSSITRASNSPTCSGIGNSVVTLLDYGCGNVGNIRNAIRRLGFDIKDVDTPEDILEASHLIFPGVYGVDVFAPAMAVLNQKGMAEALCSYIKSDRPFLGICLGMQLLFESIEEKIPVKGLGLIPGVVRQFDSNNGLAVPHVGWDALKVSKDAGILDKVGNQHVYFVHSYRAILSDANKEWVSSTCHHGDDFIASIRRGNVRAVQFHPEKSGEVGLSILRQFLHPNSPISKKPLEGKASRLAKRVIACLDVRTSDKGYVLGMEGGHPDGKEDTKENEAINIGKLVELAKQGYEDGADEVFLNTMDSWDIPLEALPMLEVLGYLTTNVFVPLTVSAGVEDFTDSNGSTGNDLKIIASMSAQKLQPLPDGLNELQILTLSQEHFFSMKVASKYFSHGVDKICIGSSALYAAEEYLRTGVKTGTTCLEQISGIYGNQAVVVRMNPRQVHVKNPEDVQFKTSEVSNPGPRGERYAWYQCTVNGGQGGRAIGAYELAKAVEELGAGEILISCTDCHGQGERLDMDLIKLVSDAVSIPVTACSGAAGTVHFPELFKMTNASAVGIYRWNEVPIQTVKGSLIGEGIEARILQRNISFVERLNSLG